MLVQRKAQMFDWQQLLSKKTDVDSGVKLRISNWPEQASYNNQKIRQQESEDNDRIHAPYLRCHYLMYSDVFPHYGSLHLPPSARPYQ